MQLQKTQSVYNKDENDLILFETKEGVTQYCANADERRQKEYELRKRTEKNIWLTVPQNKLYVRNPDSLISEYELKAIKDKQDKLEQYVKAQQKKETKKDEEKDKDKESKAGDKSQKKDGKDTESKKQSKKSKNYT